MSGGMTLQSLEFIRLLPQFMRGDLAVQGLAKAMDEIIPGLAASLERLTTWDKIAELPESELDELAWELNILWYDKGASVETKRDLILNSDKVYKSLGTKWAVENVVETYFGDGVVEEWFEYGGTPGHFRVTSANTSLNNERFAEFVYILQKVKRASAHLDAVLITLAGEMSLSAGVAFHDVSYEQYTAANPPDADYGEFYAYGDGDTIVIEGVTDFGTDGDAIILNTSLPAYADGETIVIGY